MGRQISLRRFSLLLRWLLTSTYCVGIRLCNLARQFSQYGGQYQYNPLDIPKKEIRVLTIEAVWLCTPWEDAFGTSPERRHIIHASLSHISLGEAAGYTALSYTWGDPTPTHTLSIEGKNFGITKNLYEALIHLHQAKITRLWVDAICINQEDIDERGLQVQRMAEIYRKADEVISWLGIHEDSSDTLFEWIKTTKLNHTTIDEETPIPHKHDQALIELAKRPYFSRMWVLQEFAVGRQIRIMCSNNFADPEPVSQLFYRHASTGKTGRFAPAASLVMLKQVRDMMQADTKLGLLDLLMHINSVYDKFDRTIVHNFQSSEFLDQIYGLLGLAYDSDQFIPSPVYTLSMNTLFEYMTRSIIENSRRLDYTLLEASERDSDFTVFGAKTPRGYAPTELPSWCPNYVNLPKSPINAEISGAVDFSSTPSDGMYLFRHRYGKLRACWHATQLSKLADINLWEDDSKQIQIPGMLIGKVLAHSPSDTKPNSAVMVPTELDGNSILLGLVQLLFTYSSLPLPSPSDAIIALFLALHPDLGSRSFRDISRRVFQNRFKDSQTEDEFRWLFPWAVKREYVEKSMTLSPADWDRMCDLSRNLTESTNKNYDDFRRKVVAFSPNSSARTVVDVVERYESFAWVPLATEPEDEIWLLRGCSMPVVLRGITRNTNSGAKAFAKVGPAIVNGAMDGDMWSEQDLSSIVIV